MRRDEQAPEFALAREPGQDVEQVGHVGPELRAAGQQPEVRVEAGGLRVVVAGPDVDVAAEPGALAPHDQRDLAVGLEPNEAVDDMGAGLLELAGPDDVRLLVEAGLDLDEHHDLLAALGGPDQVPDDRRVAGRPVEGHLDRQDLGILDGLADEPLDRCREALVRVMDEQVAGPDDREDVGRLVLVRRDEAWRRDRRPRRALQVRPIELGDRPEARQVEHAPDLVAVVLAEADAPQQDLAGRRWHRPLDLEADGLAESPPAKLLLDRHEEIVGLVLLEREVGVARHPEQVVLEDIHPREQHVEVRLDDLVDQDEVIRLDFDEPRQDRWNLDPGEPGLARLRIAQPDRDREAQRRDVRERDGRDRRPAA